MHTKHAYLTIDDAPSRDFEAKLDYLAARHIPAVWFCQGNLLEQHPAAALAAIRQGYILGNHTYDHPAFSGLSVTDGKAQIQRTDDIINALYREAGVTRPARFFRFPYGDKGGPARKDELQAFLRTRGHTQPAFPGITYAYYQQKGLLEDVDWYWTYDCMEWGLMHGDAPSDDVAPFGINTLEKVFARMDEDEPEGCRGLNYPGSEEIILLHDHAETSHVFEAIVERLLAKGLRFQPIPLS